MVSTIKKLTFWLLVSLSVLPLKAEDVILQAIGPFGTLNDTDNPLTLPSDKAQDLLNVEITDGGRSVKKREGFSLSQTLTITSSPVHGIYTFFDSNGNTVDLYFNDYRLSSSISGGSLTILSSTFPFGATWQCVDSQGFAYCNNTSRTHLLKTNGQTLANIAVVNSTGTMVAVSDERLITAGFSDNPNRIDFSKANDFTTWQAPFSAPTDPNQITITAPGARITHITYAFGRLMWFKNTSFGYVLFGPTLGDWTVRTVAPDLGTLDNTSTYREGILYFKGNDGHQYAYDGANLVKLTRDLEGTIAVSQNRVTGSIIQSSALDWGAGSYDSTVYVDTETSSGNLQTTFPDTFSTFRDGTSGTKVVWSTYTSGGTPPTCTYSIVSDEMNITHSGTVLGECSIYTPKQIFNYAQGTTYHMVISSIPTAATFASTYLDLILSTKVLVSPSIPTPNDFPRYDDFSLIFYSSSSSRITRIDILADNQSGTDLNYSSSSLSLTVPITVDFAISTANYVLRINNSIVTSGTHTATNRQHYPYLSNHHLTSGNSSWRFDNFGVAPQTFTYTSQLLSIGTNITSWDSFGLNNTLNDGTISYQLGSTNTPSVPAITNYQTVTNGTIPTISTGSSAAVKAAFRTDEWDDQPQLNDYTVNWFEGQASDKSYSTYFNDAIWWSVPVGTGATTNNRVLRYDLRNNGWVIYDLASNGFLVRNNNLYFGSSEEGYIYKFGGTTSDNGSAINAYWKSKDFFVDTPFNDKDFTNISVAAASQANSSMTITYAVNGSSESSYTMSLVNSVSDFTKKNRNLPLGTVGTTFSVKFGNNEADEPFEVFGIQYGVRPKPWKPTQ